MSFIRNNMLFYDVYAAEVEIDLEAGLLVGHVIDIRDEIVFQGATVKELEEAFEVAVDEYVSYVRDELGQEPERPFRGEFLVRASPQVHRDIAVAARLSGESVNAWAVEHLAQAAQQTIQYRQASVYGD